MKILQVIHGFPPHNFAGTEVYTYNLSRSLSKGHEVSVFYRVNDFKKEEFELSCGTLDNIKEFTVNNTFRQHSSFEMTYKCTAIDEKFALVLDRVKPDIVHIQHLLYLSTGIIQEAKKRGIPVVLTLNDYWLICPQGQLLKGDMSACSALNSRECINCIWHHLGIIKNIFKFYRLLKKAPDPIFEFTRNIYRDCFKAFFFKQAADLIEKRTGHMKEICSSVDLFISPSVFLSAKFASFGIPENKILISPYGLDLSNLKALKKSESQELRFGFIASLIPAKGAHVLIDSFNRINSSSCVLKIYGKESPYKGAFVNYLAQLKKTAGNNIKFMGGFDNKNISEIFSQIDVLVVPSIWPENSPLVIREAFLSKTPVVASRTGGIPELVSDGVNGLLFNSGDSRDLQAKLEYIINNHEMIEKFRANLPEVKSIEENADELEEIYSRLIDAKKSKLCYQG